MFSSSLCHCTLGGVDDKNGTREDLKIKNFMDCKISTATVDIEISQLGDDKTHLIFLIGKNRQRSESQMTTLIAQHEILTIDK